MYCMRCYKKIRFWQTPIYFYKYYGNGCSAVLHPQCANLEFENRLRKERLMDGLLKIK